MTFASPASLKVPAALALLLLPASLIAQQPEPPQSTANASKKHPAGVKYESIPVQRAEQAPPKTQPSAPAPENAKRKDGAIVAGDFNQKQSGAPLKGVIHKQDTSKN